MPPPTSRIRDRWVQDRSEDREARDLREQSGRRDLNHDRGTRDVVDDPGRRELEQLGARLTTARVLSVPTSISGGILTRSHTRKTRRARGKRRSTE